MWNHKFYSIIVELICVMGMVMRIECNATASSCDALPWLHTCEANGYDRSVPPGSSIDGGTTEVKIEIYVESIGNFKAGTMDYDMDIYFVEFWRDERLKHNYSSFLSFNDRKQLDRIWMPDLYFANSKSAEYNMVTVPNLVLKLWPNGDIRYSVRLNLKISCHMDLQAYPIDSQECYLKIVTYGSTTQTVNVSWIDGANPIDRDPNIKGTDLEVRRITAGYCNGSYFDLQFSCLMGTFYLTRNIGYSLLQVYIPTTFIVVISWMSFWIDPTSVPGRVGLSVTTLLTLSTQAIGLHYQLPPVSYAKAQDIWFAVCILFLFAALVEYALVNMFTRRCDDIASKQKAADFKYGAPTKPFLVHPDDPLLLNDAWIKSKRMAINIDRYSRMCFPLAFGLFCTFYGFGYHMKFPKLD